MICSVLLIGGKLTLMVDEHGEGPRTVLRSALTAAARTADPAPVPIVMDDPHGTAGHVSGVGEAGRSAAERVLRAAGWDTAEG